MRSMKDFSLIVDGIIISFFSMGRSWQNVVVMVKFPKKIDFFLLFWSKNKCNVIPKNESTLKIMQFSCWTFKWWKCGKPPHTSIDIFCTLSFSISHPTLAGKQSSQRSILYSCRTFTSSNKVKNWPHATKIKVEPFYNGKSPISILAVT